MPAPVLILVGVSLLAGAALGIFAVLVIGIHRGDGHLTSPPKSRSDAFTRRMLTGVRNPGGNAKGEDQ